MSFLSLPVFYSLFNFNRMKSLLLTCCFIWLCYPSWAQNRTVGTLLLEDNTHEGYTLFSPISYTDTYLIDNCGQLINSWSSDYVAGMMAYLLEDGDLLRGGRVQNLPFGAGGSSGVIERFSWEGDLEWSYIFVDEKNLYHHDFEVLPNGNILVILWYNANMVEIEGTGVDLQYIDMSRGRWFERIIEVEPIGSDEINIVWEWNVLDHLVQDQDSLKPNYGSVADSPGKLDANFPYRNTNNADWLHFNSIDYNPDLDQILISARNTSEIYIIDHSTTTEEAASDSGGRYGKGGDFLYRWGNPDIYKRGEVGAQKFHEQHDAHWLDVDDPDNQQIMIFNNGLSRPTFYSTVDIVRTGHINGEYFLDSINKNYLPNQLDWTLNSLPPLDFQSPRLSGAQRLPNGNTLVCSGSQYRMIEFNEVGQPVWVYENPVSNFGPNPENTTQGQRDLFRAFKYDLDYGAFEGRSLTPGEVLELNPTQDFCMPSSSNEEFPFNQISVFPNPASDFLTVELNDLNNIKFEITKSDGQVVQSHSLDRPTIDISTLTKGLYYIRLFRNDFTLNTTIKFIKI